MKFIIIVILASLAYIASSTTNIDVIAREEYTALSSTDTISVNGKNYSVYYDELFTCQPSFSNIFPKDEIDVAFYDEMVERFLYGRQHRLHHALWHRLRSYWDVYPSEVKEQIQALGWQPPRPTPEFTKPEHISSSAYFNGSGEDFLFFHRQMISTYRKLVGNSNYTDHSRRWYSLPRPGSRAFPIPPAWTIEDRAHTERMYTSIKSDEYFWSNMIQWEQEFRDPTYLRQLTLSEFGALIERKIHRDLHRRWAELTIDPETGEALPRGRNLDDFSKKWDSPEYDALQDFYSAHANPIFWALHGWIDERIDDWYAAHEYAHPGEISRIKVGDVEWFSVGKWVKVKDHWIWPKEFTNKSNLMTEADRITNMETVLKLVSLDNISKYQ